MILNREQIYAILSVIIMTLREGEESKFEFGCDVNHNPLFTLKVFFDSSIYIVSSDSFESYKNIDDLKLAYGV